MRKDFILHNFKFVDGLVSAKYSVVTTDDGGLIHDQIFSMKDTRAIHKDLRGLFDEATRLAAVLLDVQVDAPRFELRILGVSFTWDGDNSTIQFAGEYISDHTTAKLKTARIKYKKLDNSLQAEAAQLAQDFAREVEAYFMEGKSAEVAAFGE